MEHGRTVERQVRFQVADVSSSLGSSPKEIKEREMKRYEYEGELRLALHNRGCRGD